MLSEELVPIYQAIRLCNCEDTVLIVCVISVPCTAVVFCCEGSWHM
jgi:hypothetical protein